MDIFYAVFLYLFAGNKSMNKNSNLNKTIMERSKGKGKLKDKFIHHQFIYLAFATIATSHLFF